MSNALTHPCTAFDGFHEIAQGALIDVALAVKAALAKNPATTILTFDDDSGAVIDLDLRGSTAEIVARLGARKSSQNRPPAENAPEADASATDALMADIPSRGRGRPRLGVVAREVTLLPRHWDWLALQRGGASHALRRLVDEARHRDDGRTQSRATQETAYRFISALAGDLPGFEEATRALFAGDRDRFAEQIALWPDDVRRYALKLAR